MKAIRPIYDGMDDLDQRDSIDHVDMMTCLFSHISESIDAMEDLDDDQKQMLRALTDSEILPPGVTVSDKGINDDGYVPATEYEFDLYRGTEFDELIVMFEIVRWLKESGYEWSSLVSSEFRHIPWILGITSERDGWTSAGDKREDYVICVENKAFKELKLLLPLHWATILLDWYPVMIKGIDGEEVIEFGDLIIVSSENA